MLDRCGAHAGRCMPALRCRHKSVLQWLQLGVCEPGARFSLAWLLLQTAQNASTRRSICGEAGYLRGPKALVGGPPCLRSLPRSRVRAEAQYSCNKQQQQAPMLAGLQEPGERGAPGAPAPGQVALEEDDTFADARRAASTRRARQAPPRACGGGERGRAARGPRSAHLMGSVSARSTTAWYTRSGVARYSCRHVRSRGCERCLHHATDPLRRMRRLHDRSGTIEMSSSGGRACRTWRDGPSKVAPRGCVQSARARSSLCGGPAAEAMMIYEQHGLRPVTMPPRMAAARGAGPQQCSA